MKIYIASPLFSEMERDYIDKIVNRIQTELDLKSEDNFYVPHRDNDYDAGDYEIYSNNIEHLNECNIMVAILDGKDVDSGTAFEIGYFEAQNKVVLGLLTDTRSYDDQGELTAKLNTMVFMALNYGANVFSDIDELVEKLYEVVYK